MTRSRCRRQPRPQLANPVALAIELASKLPPDDRERLKGIIAGALDTLRRGGADAGAGAQWGVLADVLNIAEQLSALGICSDEPSRERIAAGQQALASQHRRHARTASWTLRADELAALDEAAWLAGVQLEHCSKGEFERAFTATTNRLRQARAGNAPAGAIVLGGAAP